MLLGRDTEREVIGALLEGARASRSAALVVRGEAGAGKTALLDDTRERAADMLVLSARGIESESELAYAGLQGLLRPGLDRIGGLPEPQGRALACALGMAEGGVQERFLVYSACLTLLSDLGERRPVLCVVDDAHWLDAASSEALQFVARRLGSEGVVLLFGAREGDVRSFAGEGIPSLMVDGLADDAAHEIVAEAAAGASPAVRERLVRYARGNALALVEMPAALTSAQLSGAEPLPDALPMTRQLEAAFTARIQQLPAPSATFLLVAAADDTQDLAVVTRAAAVLGADTDALDASERSGLLLVHGTRLSFRHPLVRSAVYGAATSGERRAAHAALAAVLDGDAARADRRAWHLAAAALKEDADALRELTAAARRAEDRGGHEAAARAWARAAELTADGGMRAEWMTRAARGLSVAGRDAEALALAARVPVHDASARLHADLARVRIAAAKRNGSPVEVIPELVAVAARLAPDAPDEAMELLMWATISAWHAADPGAAGGVAAVLADVRQDDLGPTSRMLGDAIRGFLATITGDTPGALAPLRRVREWGLASDDAQHVLWAAGAPVWMGDPVGFETLLVRSAELARPRGELAVLAEALGLLSIHLAVLAQRYDEAAVAAEEATALCRELGAGNLDGMAQQALAVIAAVRGRTAEARALAAPAIDVLRHRMPLLASPAFYAMALADMAEARWDDASHHLDQTAHPSDPAAVVMAPDRVEAGVMAGRLDQAQDALATYAARAGKGPWEARRLAGMRALMARGAEATRLFEEAVTGAGGDRPFESARVLLAFGRHLRRDGQRVAAREQLRTALQGFEALGAEPWAERAREELRASGETARKRSGGEETALTPQELQIARLVGQGLTNKEVAAQLFLSPRTIDAHLRGVFAKLGVSSRRELRHLPLTGERPPEEEAKEEAVPA